MSDETKKKGWFKRLREGLSRSSNALTGGISDLITKRKLDETVLEELEDILIQSDLGVETAMAITDQIGAVRREKDLSDEDIRAILSNEIEAALQPVAHPLILEDRPLNIILVCGVNGSGKTTTIGKLAAKYSAEGKKLVLAAGDTFRAAAVEQLKIWGERTGAEVVMRDTGADAAGLVYDAIEAAKQSKADILLIDTAGRLQNKTDLMDELKKVVRIIQKQDETAPHHSILVLDATVGQNALSQVKIFNETVGLSGLVMTKLDGTARGGILVPIAKEHKLPVHAIGVGEGIDDLQPFEAKDFANAISGFDG